MAKLECCTKSLLQSGLPACSYLKHAGALRQTRGEQQDADAFATNSEDVGSLLSRVLKGRMQPSRVREECAPMEYPKHAHMQEADASEWRAPCETCGRRYYHEHVRSVTRGNQHPGDEPD